MITSDRSDWKLFRQNTGHHPSHCWSMVAAGIICCALSALVAADELQNDNASAAPLLSGKPLQSVLLQRRGLVTANLPLRKALTDLQRETGIAVVIDRRTDPGRLLNVATGYVAVRDALTEIAGSMPDTGVSFGDNYVYIGPKEASERLRTLVAMNADHVRSLRHELNADVYRELVKPRDCSWTQASEPRQLLASAVEKSGLTMANSEVIPHDLWAQVDIPDVEFSEFATLVLNQFDSSFELTGDGSLRIVALPEAIGVEQRHRVPVRDKQAIAKRWAAVFPDLQITWRGSSAEVFGMVELHERLDLLASGPAAAGNNPDPISTRVFTMKTPGKVTVLSVVTNLRNAGIPIRIEGRDEEELRILLEQKVEFDLDKVEGSEFFAKAFSGWGAAVEVRDDEVLLAFPEK